MYNASPLALANQLLLLRLNMLVINHVCSATADGQTILCFFCLAIFTKNNMKYYRQFYNHKATANSEQLTKVYMPSSATVFIF